MGDFYFDSQVEKRKGGLERTGTVEVPDVRRKKINHNMERSI